MQTRDVKLMAAATTLALLLAFGIGAQEPVGTESVEPANWDHVRKLDFPVRWNLWRCQDPDAKPDLRRANLSRKDGRDNLRDLNLRDTDLRGANMRGANLSGADLTGANLEGADLTGAYYNDQTRFPDSFDPGTAGLKRG